MATKRILVKLCDSCGQQTETRRVRITIEGDRGIMGDLCATCRKPLVKLRDTVTDRRGPRFDIASLPVTTVEEVEKIREKEARAAKRAAVRPLQPR